MGRWIIGTAMALCALALAACAKTERWSEEVRLSSGQVIVVEREARSREARIRFTLPGQPQRVIEWNSRRASEVRGGEKPLVLDVENGVPVILTIAVTSPGCRLFTRYSNRDNAWIEEVLPDKFRGREMNLFIHSPEHMPHFVTLAQKSRAQANVSYARSLKYLGPVDKVCG